MNNQLNRVLFALTAGVCFTCASSAETAYWSNSSGVSGTGIDWLTPSNFTNENGAVFSESPTNGHNLVFNALEDLPAAKSFIPDSKLVMHQTVGAGKSAIPSPHFGSIAGQDRYTLKFHDNYTVNEYYGSSAVRTITVDNPNDFLGYWLSGGMLTTFTLAPTADFTPVMRNVSSLHRPVVQVPQNEARIDYLYGGGSIEKRGGGNLHIASFSGEPAAVYLKEGSLTLEGASEERLGELLAGAALHLDASAEGTLVTAMREGYQSVYRWSDVRGEEGYYYATNSNFIGTKSHQIPFAVPPYIASAAVSPTGLPLVDFGSRSRSDVVNTDFPSRGPTNCMLRLNQRITGVRAVFYAASNPNGMYAASVLGDTDHHPFITAGSTALYCPTYSDPAARYGFITLNGKKTFFTGLDAEIFKKMYTCGNLLQRDVAVGLLGSREYYHDQNGGTRMGEVIVFTNELTKAESALITRYLDAKWRTGDSSRDIDAVIAAADIAGVTVPEGTSFSAGSIESAGAFVKRGGGRLEVGSMQAGGGVTVEDGSLAFTGAEVSDDAPAADPYIWLDASAEGVFTGVESGDSGKNYISAWKDVRTGCDLSATSASNSLPNMPHVVMSDICNRRVVDFGEYAGNTKGNDSFAWMMLPNWGKNTHDSYSAFMIFRVPKKVYNAVIFGSSTFASYRDRATSIISPNYLSAVPGAAVWAINGRAVDPFSCSDPTGTDEFILVSVRTASPMRYDALSKDRSGKSEITFAGGHQIGEVILYDRPLSTAEHSATEAYLMKKWLGKDHPSKVKSSFSRMEFSDSIDAVVESDLDMNLDALTGGNGTFVKKGGGTLTVNNPDFGSLNEVSVEEGTLAIEVSVLDNVAYHFDASAAKTFAKTEIVDGVTNLLSWCSRTGTVTADAVISDVAKTNPVMRTVETAPGVMRTVVDFGEYCSSTNGVITDGVGATMKFSTRFKSSIKDIVQVSADANGSNKQWIFGDTHTTDTSRGKNGKLWENDKVTVDGVSYMASSIVRNSRSWIDGKSAIWDTVVPEGFHVFSLSCNKIGHDAAASWYTSVGSLAGGLHTMAGGMYIAETIGFSSLLTDEERRVIEKHLGWKWLGWERPAALYTNEIGSVAMAAGTRLELPREAGLVDFKVGALSGIGVIAGDIIGVSSFTAKFGAEGAVPLTVEGEVEFADVVTVNVVSEDGELLPYGDYTLFTAASANLDEVRLNLNHELDGRRRYKVYADGDDIVLRVIPSGLTVIVR